MAFYPEDPLADLSDGSNDSFFEDPKLLHKRASLTKTPEKKSVTDLFNLTDEKASAKKESRKNENWLDVQEKPKTPSTAPKEDSVRKITFDDDNDLLSNLGLQKKPSDLPQEPSKTLESPALLEKKSKKSDLLGSILAPTKSEGVIKNSIEDILKDSKIKSQSKTDVSEPPHPGFSSLESNPREGRRGRRPSAGLLDPLGLFGKDIATLDTTLQEPAKDKINPSLMSSDRLPDKSETQSRAGSKPSDVLPDWLGGSSTTKSSKTELTTNEKSEVLHQPIVSKSQPEFTSESAHESHSIPDKPYSSNIEIHTQGDNTKLFTSAVEQKMAQSDLEYQNSYVALQQQESQLLMALQLKKYEDNLLEIQRQQQQVLTKQDKQFNILLERYFAKQQIMENNMKLQQERINNHIQMLISHQPNANVAGSEEELKFRDSMKEENFKFQENMINSLKQRQHEEIFLLEESYKKQITFLEQSMEAVESRLKAELENLIQQHEKKIVSINQNCEEEIDKYKKKLMEVERQHADEIKQMRENHTRIIEEIKYEHSTLIESFKQSKQSGHNVFSDGKAYMQKLDSNIEALNSSSNIMQDIQNKIQSEYDVLLSAREETLKAKEHEITLMRTTLEKSRDTAELERSQLMALVRNLETKIAEQSQSSREERWALQQAAATLNARSAAVEREVEFNRNSIEREREQLKVLKETILAEQEKNMLQLTEEKLALSAEKSRIEVASKLNVNYDAQRMKVEVEAAIQVAREAAELADQEREKLISQQRETEIVKRTLADRERKLVLRERDLEVLTQTAERKLADGENALLESRSLENRYKERFRELQSQLTALSVREKKLTEEKMTISKERLALYTMMRQTRKCGLCAVDAPNFTELNLSRDDIHADFPRYVNVVDPDIEQIRLHATEEYDDVIHTDENTIE